MRWESELGITRGRSELGFDRKDSGHTQAFPNRAKRIPGSEALIVMTASKGMPQVAQAPVSLWELASREANDFKWLESERSGYDVGPFAQVEWSRRYWRIFCRHRRIEHLMGERLIREFDEESFGRLSDPELRSRPVVRFVIDQFAHKGWENLDFLLWAPHHGFDSHELHEVLSLVDVNAARFDPPCWDLDFGI